MSAKSSEGVVPSRETGELLAMNATLFAERHPEDALLAQWACQLRDMCDGPIQATQPAPATLPRLTHEHGHLLGMALRHWAPNEEQGGNLTTARLMRQVADMVDPREGDEGKTEQPAPTEPAAASDPSHDPRAFCRCGHPYERHWWDGGVGCKYCGCTGFREPDEDHAGLAEELKHTWERVYALAAQPEPSVETEHSAPEAAEKSCGTCIDRFVCRFLMQEHPQCVEDGYSHWRERPQPAPPTAEAEGECPCRDHCHTCNPLGREGHLPKCIPGPLCDTIRALAAECDRLREHDAQHDAAFERMEQRITELGEELAAAKDRVAELEGDSDLRFCMTCQHWRQKMNLPAKAPCNTCNHDHCPGGDEENFELQETCPYCNGQGYPPMPGDDGGLSDIVCSFCAGTGRQTAGQTQPDLVLRRDADIRREITEVRERRMNEIIVAWRQRAEQAEARAKVVGEQARGCFRLPDGLSREEAIHGLRQSAGCAKEKQRAVWNIPAADVSLSVAATIERGPEGGEGWWVPREQVEKALDSMAPARAEGPAGLWRSAAVSFASKLGIPIDLLAPKPEEGSDE